jgi:hypothetical protein
LSAQVTALETKTVFKLCLIATPNYVNSWYFICFFPPKEFGQLKILTNLIKISQKEPLGLI